jgi:hypothetical protein
MTYEMAVTIASINLEINQKNQKADPWAGTQTELISRIYNRDLETVRSDVRQLLEHRIPDRAAVL